jgi:regulator of sigma E protease
VVATLVPDASPTDTLADGRARGIIGVVLASPTRRDPVTLAQALAGGWRETANWSTQIVRSVRGMLFGRVSSRDVGGPILIGQLAAQTARAGLEPFLAFMADGGQFLFLLGEAVLRRPLSLKLRERLTMVGLALILALMVLAFSNDIRRLLGF